MKMLLLFIVENEKFNLSQVADILTKIFNIQNFSNAILLALY